MRYVPKPGPTETSTDYRLQAHRQLDALLDAAESERAFGEVGVIVAFDAGRITFVKKHLIGTYK